MSRSVRARSPTSERQPSIASSSSVVTCAGRLPNANGGMQGKSARIFQEVLRRVLARAGFALAQRGGKQRPYIRFHDLRHTMASHCAMKGGDLFKLQRILGHKSIATLTHSI